MVQVEPPIVVLPEARPARPTVAGALAERRAAHEQALAWLARHGGLAEIAGLLVETLRGGHTVLVAGNGGSAAEAQHFAAELVGRFQRDRQPYAALALSTDSSVLTAVANDYGYEQVFARQLLALGRPGDLFLAFSTSGESENLVRAAVAARSRGMAVVAVTGEGPNRLARLARPSLRIPARSAAIIQELHMVVTHVLCTIVEAELAEDEADV